MRSTSSRIRVRRCIARRKAGKRFRRRSCLRRVAGLSKALRELGVKPGDRVGLFAPNCPEWHIADFAIQGLGAVNVPVYFNESPDRLIYILNDSGAQIVITVGDSQARKLAESRAKLTDVRHVISAAPLDDLHGDVLLYEALIAHTGDSGRGRVPSPRGGSKRESARHDHLHVGHDRRAQRRDAESLEHQFECARRCCGASHGSAGRLAFRFCRWRTSTNASSRTGICSTASPSRTWGEWKMCRRRCLRCIPIAPRRCRDSSKRFTRTFWRRDTGICVEAKGVRLGVGRRSKRLCRGAHTERPRRRP